MGVVPATELVDELLEETTTDELLDDEMLEELEEETLDEVAPQLPWLVHTCHWPEFCAGLSPCVHQLARYLMPLSCACMLCV